MSDLPPGEHKKKFRSRMKQVLRVIDGRDAAAESERACEALLESTTWARARTVMAYAPTGGEVDVTPIMHAALDAGHALVLPRMDWDAGTMEPAKVADLRELRVRRHEIPEPPASAPTLEPARIDLVLVPALAFDETGRRLGRGAGYYDRFLPRLSASCTIVGVCFQRQVAGEIPAEEHDICVQMLLTEHGLRRAIRV